MNNHYTFKAKRKDNGEWVYGNLIYDDITDKYWIDLSISESEMVDGYLYVYAIEVDPDTLCQCTELPDKDGNMLYESDICEYVDTQWGNRYIFKIEYLESRFITRMANGSYGELKDMFHLNKYESIKRIGNFIDNPELFSEVDE